MKHLGFLLALCAALVTFGCSDNVEPQAELRPEEAYQRLMGAIIQGDEATALTYTADESVEWVKGMMRMTRFFDKGRKDELLENLTKCTFSAEKEGDATILYEIKEDQRKVRMGTMKEVDGTWKFVR